MGCRGIERSILVVLRPGATTWLVVRHQERLQELIEVVIISGSSLLAVITVLVKRSVIIIGSAQAPLSGLTNRSLPDLQDTDSGVEMLAEWKSSHHVIAGFTSIFKCLSSRTMGASVISWEKALAGTRMPWTCPRCCMAH